ncbi:hypothetical protein TNCV_2701171, partial [Trichonephila clavipes]
MINEPVKPHHTVTFGECNDFCVYSRGLEVAQMRQLWLGVTMKREMSFICPQDVKKPRWDPVLFREGPLPAMLPSVRYLLAKVHGTIAICMGTAGGFDEEYCGQMMV